MNAQSPLLEALWPQPADADAARIGRERWQERAAELPELRAAMESLADSPGGGRMLAALFGGSPFLSGCALREPGLLLALAERGPDALCTEIFADLATAAAAETDRARLVAALRIAKRRIALLTAVADIADLWPLRRVTETLSLLAERAMDAALAHLLRSAAARGLIAADATDPATCGLVILGMGKLGARELNYSSDIDLIILYDPQHPAVPADRDPGPLWVRITRDLAALMEERTADGYVFRVDLRLRPDAGATPPAISIPAAENYYTSVAQTWERAAMIKARPVAGNRVAGRDFLDFLAPFIWRKSLDFAAIRDIRAIKRQIHDHRRHGADAAADPAEGRDVKLGRGGIREIEFFVQTHQMIWGGREPSLRLAGTVEALHALIGPRLVEPAVAERMTAAYRTLRRIEHRLQMVDDRQTHALPTDAAAFARFALFLGLEDADALRALVHATARTVETCSAALLADQDDGEDGDRLVFAGVDDPPATVAALTEMGYRRPGDVIAMVRAWLAARYRALRSEQARRLLDAMLPKLLAAFGRAADPDGAIARFDRLISGLPAGVQLFALFEANPELFDLVAEILGVGGRFASHLAETPRQLDAVLTADFYDALAPREDLAASLAAQLATARAYEEALDLLRRWTNDQRFRAGVHLLRGLTDGDGCARFLSDVAELGLDAALRAAESEFATRHGRFPAAGFVILGMGKLAGREMSIRSDLDLVMIYDGVAADEMSDGPKPLAASTYFLRLTQRVLAAVTARTAEGALYEVDMRLRPSGSAGPAAVAFDAFLRYQREQAWTWEHMALTRARPVAGSPDLARRIETAVQDILSAARDPGALARDVAEMRRRIEAQHRTTNPWDVKHVRGGLVDVEFIAQYLQLREAARHAGVTSPGTRRAIAKLAGTGALAPADADTLARAHRLFQTVQGFLRLTIDSAQDLDQASPALLRALARMLGVVLEDRDLGDSTDPRAEGAAILAAHQAQVTALYERLLGDPHPAD